MTYTQPVITSDVGTFSPYLITTATRSIASRNIAHDLLGGGVAVTYGGDGLQTTTLQMLFTSESSALTAFNQLNTGHIFELQDYSKTSTSLFFSVVGTITRDFQVDTDDTWIVSCDIQEVTP